MPPRHSVRSTSICSSMRAPRRSKGCSSCVNSSRIHPAPTPSSTRSSDSQAAVPTALATTNGLRTGSTYTWVENRMRSVTAASAPVVTHTSGHCVSGANTGRPEGVYGYAESSLSG